VIIIAAALFVVLTVPLTGRSLAPLAHVPIRRSWVVWAAMLIQLPITLMPTFPETLGEVLHMLSFALAGVFVWSNRHLPGELVIAAGGLMNLIAIAANGGTMPASESAWRIAGFPPPTDAFGNSSIVESARVWWLGDVFAIPESWPLSNVFSVGDVIIVLGLAYLAHATCRAQAPAVVAALPLATMLSARVVLQELGDDMRLLRDHCHQLSIALGSLQDSLKKHRTVATVAAAQPAPQLQDIEVSEPLREEAMTH